LHSRFGGSDWDEYYSVQQTSDDGYILAGYTESFGAGLSDFLLDKRVSYGFRQWNRTFGGTSWDKAKSVQQTSDGGYILAGFTGSYGAGFSDLWLVKTDADGNEQWNKTFGGFDWDTAESVQQTSDNGYILAGYTFSYGAGSADVWLLKTDADGNKQWDRTFGGTGDDFASSVQQTADDGYILAGYTESLGAGSFDAWLIKADSEGNEQWNRTFGGAEMDSSFSVQQTADGGYILAGYTESYGAGSSDFWLIKVNGEGTNSGFDTQQSEKPYPSISGIHTGTITPSRTITVNTLYTYPCAGTGGHTEYARIYGNGLDRSASWVGYHGDWHNISFTAPFILEAGKTYYYEIRTGSYLQIHHTDELEAVGGAGTITCTNFTDVNGKEYTDWIPAIRLE
jgi:hypothetical protein